MAFIKGLGLRGPDTAMMARPRVHLPALDPSTLSYTYLDMFGPIENQDVTSECWDYSPSGMFEAYHYRRTGSRFVVSKRATAYLATLANDPSNLTDSGGYPSWAIGQYEKGYVLESDWPSDSNDDSVQMTPVPSTLVRTDFLASGVLSIDTDASSVILAGHEHGPVAICVNWPQEWYTDTPLDDDGYLVQLQNASNAVGGHAICMAAHLPADALDSGSPEVVMIRNSWGAWGGGKAPSGYAYARVSDLAQILIDGNCCMAVS